MLDIYAGPTAKKILDEQGFIPEIFKILLGASGGPKWFVLYHLDKLLFGDFFKDNNHKIDLIGSSAGGFRFSCLSQTDPIKAIDTLAEHYSTTVYSKKPTPQEITEKAVALLDDVTPTTGMEHFFNHEQYRLHLIAARCKGLTTSENKWIQLSGLLSAYCLNRVSRKLLELVFERIIFSSEVNSSLINDPYQLTTQYVSLVNDNYRDALLATGSIPLVLEGVKDIALAPTGVYRDGGIIDYHFDFEFGHLLSDNDLVLFPHFSMEIKPGWFDKNLNRRPGRKSLDRMVVLAPSNEFVSTLPFQKIPDRKDFSEIEDNTRIRYWQNVLQQTERLADDLNARVSGHKPMNILPLY